MLNFGVWINPLDLNLIQQVAGFLFLFKFQKNWTKWRKIKTENIRHFQWQFSFLLLVLNKSGRKKNLLQGNHKIQINQSLIQEISLEIKNNNSLLSIHSK